MYDSKKSLRQVSIPSLIGWISLCMLAAAWGRTIDPEWQNLWGKAGAIGLVGAVIFDRADRARKQRQLKIEEESARATSEDRLSRLNEYEETQKSVVVAVHELSAFAGSDLNQYPLKVRCVTVNDESYEVDWTHAVHGELIIISANSVCFSHEEDCSTRIVLLEFKLQKNKTLCFVVAIAGTQSTDNGYISTGSLLATGVPQNAEPSAEHNDHAGELQTV
jgi:hypothetical protein